jgi:hypothetical protein
VVQNCMRPVDEEALPLDGVTSDTPRSIVAGPQMTLWSKARLVKEYGGLMVLDPAACRW